MALTNGPYHLIILTKLPMIFIVLTPWEPGRKKYSSYEGTGYQDDGVLDIRFTFPQQKQG